MTVTEDRDAITQLIFRFYALMDDGRFNALDAVLTEDVVAGTPGGGQAEGRKSVVDNAARAHTMEERTQHLVQNVLVDVDGDKATVRAGVIAMLGASTPPEGAMAPEPSMTLSTIMGYDVIRTAEGWRVKRIEGSVIWLTTKPLVPAGQ